MCMDMSTGHDHSYYLTKRERVIELSWPLPPGRLSTGLTRGVLSLLRGRPNPGSPAACVDPEAFRAAVQVLEDQDLEQAIAAFTGLGYQVTVRTLR